MNMQQIMAQAQRMQKDILNKKKDIDNQVFEGKSDWVSIKMKGDKSIVSINILDSADLSNDNKDILEDMFSIALKNVLDQIEKETEKKLGSYANVGGLF